MIEMNNSIVQNSLENFLRKSLKVKSANIRPSGPDPSADQIFAPKVNRLC